MSVSLSHKGLPPGVNRFQLLTIFEEVAKPRYGLSRTAILLMREYIWRTFDQDYEPDRVCAVWSRVSSTARRLSLTTRSINQAERELEEQGFLLRTTGVNGARSGKRNEGRVIWAAGANLAPLIDRLDELTAVSEAQRLQNMVIDECQADIRRINKCIRINGDVNALAAAQKIIPGGRVSRICRIDRLREILSDLQNILAALKSVPSTQKTSDASEENGSLNIPGEDSRKTRNAVPNANNEFSLSPNQALKVAHSRFSRILELYGEPTWPNIVKASEHVLSEIGISGQTWRNACSKLGREKAALCVIIIQQNLCLPAGHPYRAVRGNSCLRGMTKKHEAGSFNLKGMWGVLSSFEKQEREPDFEVGFGEPNQVEAMYCRRFGDICGDLAYRIERKSKHTQAVC